MVHSVQTVHLSCTNTNTISKRTEMRFDMTYVTKEFHRMRPQWFPTPWGILHKPCTYITLRLALSLNRPKKSFHLSPITKGDHWVRPKWFLSQWYVWSKPCTYLAPILTLSPNGPKRDSTWPMSPRSSIRCVQNSFRPYGTFGANRAPILRQD
jgi:hypothetical protein